MSLLSVLVDTGAALVALGAAAVVYRQRRTLVPRQRIGSELGLSEATRLGVPPELVELSRQLDTDDLAGVEHLLEEAAADDTVRIKACTSGTLRRLASQAATLSDLTENGGTTTLRFVEGTTVDLDGSDGVGDLRTALAGGSVVLAEVAYNEPAAVLTFLSGDGPVRLATSGVHVVSV
jgi:hypothetical protein